jgi:hypothetical protein
LRELCAKALAAADGVRSVLDSTDAEMVERADGAFFVAVHELLLVAPRSLYSASKELWSSYRSLRITEAVTRTTEAMLQFIHDCRRVLLGVDEDNRVHLVPDVMARSTSRCSNSHQSSAR